MEFICSSIHVFPALSVNIHHNQWLENKGYRQTSNISSTIVDNNIIDNSDVVGAHPVGAAPTTSSFSTKHLVSMDWAETTARQGKNLLCFGIWCALYYRFYSSLI